MALFRKICIFDFETDGTDPQVCQPVQIAAIMIDPRNLKPIPGSEFSSFMKPNNIDKSEYFTEDIKKTIEWHAGNYKCEYDKIVATWKEAANQELVWRQFASYINKYNWKGTMFSAPIAGGANIRNFDLIIANRLNTQYNIQTMFWPRDVIDIIDLAFMWFSFIDKPPSNYKMETLRNFFNMKGEISHDALGDVRDSAEMICRFLRLHKYLAPKVKFK